MNCYIFLQMSQLFFNKLGVLQLVSNCFKVQ